MPWNLNSDRPIYIQLMDKIKLDIVTGFYHAGAKLPSVRELAADASVNPNTMQKALSELEQLKLVFSQRTSGRFITEDQTMLDQLKSQLALEKITTFLSCMEQLGYQSQDIITLITMHQEEESNEHISRM